jgi:four helix bundle protein
MNDYQEQLKQKMDKYVHFVYQQTKGFPKQERYGSITQWRRCTLSIILNYIEGYARRKPLVSLNFLAVAYGLLMESDYLLNFCRQEGYLDVTSYDSGVDLSKQIGAMLWTEIVNLEKSKTKSI